MKTVIFSDVHLTSINEAGRERMAVLVAFLRSIDTSTVRRLIVLGDLFDFWFEYKHVIFSMYFDVLRALADLRDAGVQMHFVVGNHDFWAGRFLREQLSFTVHAGPAMFDFGGQRVLCVHGDGINPTDYGYRIYKEIARFPLVVWLFGLLHPDWAMALGNLVSGGSRHFLQREDVSQGPEARALRAFAQRELAAGHADVVICGHAHHPECTPYPTPAGSGLYINSGDWIRHRSFVVWDDGAGFQMLEFAGLGENGAHGDTGHEAQEQQR